MQITGGQYVGDKGSPGPGAYDIRNINKTTIAYSFRPRTLIGREFPIILIFQMLPIVLKLSLGLELTERLMISIRKENIGFQNLRILALVLSLLLVRSVFNMKRVNLI